ncbi:MAG: hypothetical protein K0S57_3109 [Ramlibacter sp.]|nr:hypothetical protein [Ramlibacter sp.]
MPRYVRRLHPDALLPRPARHRPCRLRFPAGARRQHRGSRAVQRPRHRPVLHAGALRLRPADAGGPAGPAEALRRGLPHGLEAARRAPADEDGDLRQQGRPLPQRPAVPVEERAAAAGHPRDRLQPPRVLPAGRRLQRALPPHPGDRRHQGAGRGAPVRGDRVGRRRAGGAGALHADPVGRPVPQAGRSRHQHPPQLPAQLQGRQALLPGARSRREADRRDRPLRDRRPRRGSDHRAGRRPGRSLVFGGKPHRAGPRHREHGAGARRQVAQRAPRAHQRPQDRDLATVLP